MNENNIKAIFEDEEFAKNLFTLETTEKAQAALKAKGIDMSKDEILALRDALLEATEKATAKGEMGLEQLDDVAGGSVLLINPALKLPGAQIPEWWLHPDYKGSLIPKTWI